MLKKDPYEYAIFSYYLGIAYFYQYDGNGNKQMAEKWFRNAAESGMLSEAQTLRAESFSNICKYYNKLGIPDDSGDSIIRYSYYWNDIKQSASGDIASIDNPITALVIYKESCVQIYNNAYNFNKESIKYSEIKALLDEIDERLNTDFQNIPDVQKEQVCNMKTEIKEDLNLARKEIDMAYGIVGSN